MNKSERFYINMGSFTMNIPSSYWLAEGLYTDKL